MSHPSNTVMRKDKKELSIPHNMSIAVKHAIIIVIVSQARGYQS